jgi:transcriptional regulator with XRE-family HTH domain
MQTIRSMELGERLRHLREAAELKHEEACAQLGWSRSKLDRTEAGKHIPKLGDLQAALDLYNAADGQRGALEKLRLEAKAGRRGWWIGYGDVFNGSLPALEDSARKIRCFETNLVPGLAQVAKYARALIRTARPEDTDDEVDKRVRARMARQDAVYLRSNTPAVHFIIDEVALLRPIGGSEVLRDQISALWDLGQRPTVTVKIIPLEAGEHAGHKGGFEILNFDVDAYPEVAFTAGQAGDVYLEGAADLARLNHVWDRLAMAALSPEDSARRCAELTRK